MSGKKMRFDKLFGNGENAVVVAVDHGAQFGALPGIADLPGAIGQLAAADGLLMNPGTLDSCRHVFSGRHSPMFIARLTWTTAYCFPWKYDRAHTSAVLSPQEALFRGADMITACCVVKSGDQAVDAENVRLFTDVAARKEACGIPLIGEFYPMGAEELPAEELHEVVRIGARMLWELGADAIKTFYTGKRFADITASVPVPILVLGASKQEKEQDALMLAYQAVSAGARGVAFGRNVFQAQNPSAFLQALKDVVKNKVKPAEAARLCGKNRHP